MNTRILHKTGSTVTDFTKELLSYEDGTQAVTLATTDYIYIGQRVPFNHLYFKSSVPNTNAANMAVKIWDGESFVAVAETIDETEGLTQSGFITFQPNRDVSGWASEHTEDITEINNLTIYDLYWCRVETDTLQTATTLDFIGQKFSDDNDIKGENPALLRANLLEAFETGKTDWEAQHVKAAELIVKDLIERQVIEERGQILRREQLYLASVKKVEEIIYTALGDDYEDDRLKARAEYLSRLSKGLYQVDKNKDADLSLKEGRNRTGFMNR